MTVFTFEIPTILTKNKPGILSPFDLKTFNQMYNRNFVIKNLFYIEVDDLTASRGNHRNMNTSEILICQRGKFKIEIEGTKYELTKNQAIFISNDNWLRFYDFEDSIILVLTDTFFDEKITSEK